MLGRSAGRHVDHPWGGGNFSWPARKVTDSSNGMDDVIFLGERSIHHHQRNHFLLLFDKQSGFVGNERKGFKVGESAIPDPHAALQIAVGVNFGAPCSAQQGLLSETGVRTDILSKESRVGSGCGLKFGGESH